MIKRQLTLLFFFISLSVFSQELYKGQVYDEITKSVHTYSDTLKLDFYTAKEAVENTDRPLLILVHGGGFTGGKRDNPLESEFCKTMATKGYAVASISYSLTRKGTATGFGCNCPADEKISTFKETTSDILKAIDYLKIAGDFNFAHDKIVLVGSSAGAEGVLNTAYLANYPGFKDLPTMSIAAVVSFSGAVMDARYITPQNAVPAFLVHGEKDKLVPYATAAHHYCDPTDSGYLFLDGSSTIIKKLKDLNASYYFLSDPEGTHDWAGLGFRYTDAIAGFIFDVVVNGGKVQFNEEVSQ
ncbi:alpha/beta hydrolase [Leeuwenhoekiella sp. A16]|uniref:alpha/beta hydrolase n=1 Tax=Leeuwenhoekiella sp. A16 TaxID=3141462 RepID=UPI003A8111B4